MPRSSKSARPASPLHNQLATLERQLGPIEHRAPASLSTYANNPRRHPEKQIVTLQASIQEFGFLLPVLVDEDNVIIAGEARVEAAKRLGVASVPVLIVSHLSKAQVKAYRLADNRLAELSTWDEARLAIEFAEILAVEEVAIDVLGWESAQIDVILDTSNATSQDKEDPADKQIASPEHPVSRPGDLWLLGKHRIICGSSLEETVWTRLMNCGVATMSFVDPPYNVSVTKHVGGLGKIKHAEFAMASGEMSRAEFVAFLTRFLEQLAAHVVDGGIIDIAMDWRHMSELLEAMAKVGLSLLNLCVWNKANGGMGSLYRSKHELIAIAKKGDASHINNVQLGKHGRYRTNVWDYAGVNSFGASRMDDLASHPTVKPLALVADAIRDVSNPGDIVVDAFLGSGTTLLAAERTKRIGYGIEIAPAYVDVAVRRWEKMTGLGAILDGSGRSFAEIAAERAADRDLSPAA